ncbi:MAG: arginine--tRNA ligase [Caldilineaceae bacterium]|nr:arginine--tRNA ligase [Caldilineaceae bacterium]
MLRDQIQAIVAEAIQAAADAGELPSIEMPAAEIMRPNRPEHGDFSTNIAMVVAAAVKKATGEKSNPRQIAQTIADRMPTNGMIGAVELAGPGFINLRLSQSWLQGQVRAIVDAGADFAAIDLGRGRRWQVEFVSANPTGPLHFGGARNAVLGDALANVLDAAGFAVQREYYVNDAGTQMQLFVETLYARYLQHFGREAEIPEGGYKGDYMIEYAKRLAEKMGDSLLGMDRDAALAAIRPEGRAIVLADLQDELALIGVRFDEWFSEQSLYDNGEVDEVLAMLREKGEIAERDGAQWFLASNYPKNDKDEVVIRSTGAPTYFASDIAYHYNKFIRRGFEKVINVWAVDHQGHVPRMHAVMQSLGLDPERLVILLYNLVKLMRDGQEVKMSKRSGDFLTLREVVEEVGSDAVRFMLLTRGPESSIDFDLNLAVEQTSENPVFYVQYGHARICSIIEKAGSEGLLPEGGIAAVDDSLLALLEHPAELDLIRKMLELEEQIETAVDKLSPHNLTHYGMELARVFTMFYRDCHVVDSENADLSRARLLLSQAARTALARVLGLLGVSAPQSM